MNCHTDIDTMSIYFIPDQKILTECCTYSLSPIYKLVRVLIPISRNRRMKLIFKYRIEAVR